MTNKNPQPIQVRRETYNPAALFSIQVSNLGSFRDIEIKVTKTSYVCHNPKRERMTSVHSVWCH